MYTDKGSKYFTLVNRYKVKYGGQAAEEGGQSVGSGRNPNGRGRKQKSVKMHWVRDGTTFRQSEDTKGRESHQPPRSLCSEAKPNCEKTRQLFRELL